MIPRFTLSYWGRPNSVNVVRHRPACYLCTEVPRPIEGVFNFSASGLGRMLKALLKPTRHPGARCAARGSFNSRFSLFCRLVGHYVDVREQRWAHTVFACLGLSGTIYICHNKNDSIYLTVDWPRRSVLLTVNDLPEDQKKWCVHSPVAPNCPVIGNKGQHPHAL